MTRAAVALLIMIGMAAAPATTDPPIRPGAGAHRVKAVHITILSTMLADQGMGEWGFAALIEADGRRLLFDTGDRPETVLQNARELGIDLSTVTDVVLSHHHADHTGGLLTLRRELAKVNPAALSRIHVAPGIFLSRRKVGSDAESNPAIALKDAVEAGGGVFIEHRGPVELLPGVWLTGPIPRRYPERNWGPPMSLVTARGLAPDSIPEDMALVLNTDKGLVIVAGCGHAGTINTVEYARDVVAPGPLYALIGGLHLFAETEETLAWTAAKLRAAGLVALLGAHCTGIEAVFRIRELAGLTRSTAVVAAVGSSFDLDRGIDPLALAQ